MAGTIHVGTSGWHYPAGRGTWNGIFYPASRPRGFQELSYYAEHFDTVEVNATFYRMIEAPMARQWLARTPSSFRFSVKLYQKFTHPDLYLSRQGVTDWDLSRADIDLFRRGLDPIVEDGRLGALLMQFPPSFHRQPETTAYLEWLLEAFAGLPAAVELRHRTWSDAAEATAQLLEGHAAAWVLIDEPKFASSIRQPHAGLPTPAGPRSAPSLAYVRLHGRNAAQWWDHEAAEDRYDYLYSPAELAPFAEHARTEAAAGRRVFLYLNNHFSAKAAANAAILKHAIGQPLDGDYPREMITRYPALDGLVATAGLPL
jgi:uncharacterized protein YecE (DUF72 family)